MRGRADRANAPAIGGAGQLPPIEERPPDRGAAAGGGRQRTAPQRGQALACLAGQVARLSRRCTSPSRGLRRGGLELCDGCRGVAARRAAPAARSVRRWRPAASPADREVAGAGDPLLSGLRRAPESRCDTRRRKERIRCPAPLHEARRMKGILGRRPGGRVPRRTAAGRPRWRRPPLTASSWRAQVSARVGRCQRGSAREVLERFARLGRHLRFDEPRTVSASAPRRGGCFVELALRILKPIAIEVGATER